MAFEGSKEKLGIFAELWLFMKVRKKWWLGPIVLMLALLGKFIPVYAFTSANNHLILQQRNLRRYDLQQDRHMKYMKFVARPRPRFSSFATGTRGTRGELNSIRRTCVICS